MYTKVNHKLVDEHKMLHLIKAEKHNIAPRSSDLDRWLLVSTTEFNM